MNSLSPAKPAPAGSRARRIAAAGLMVLVSAACSDGVGPRPQAEEQLLFVSTRGDDRQVDWRDLGKSLHRMNADGTGVQNLSLPPSEIYRSLSLSPDGRKVAFNSDAGGCYDLWVMNTDGTLPQQLTGVPVYHRCNSIPRWSPDGARIAFTSTRGGSFALWVMNADGSAASNVWSPPTPTSGYAYPAGWAPDGRVAFHYVEANGAIHTYLVNAAGTGLTPMFARDGDASPAWSPNGSKVAFISDRDGSPSVYVMNADGSNVVRLSNLPGEDLFWPSLGYWENDYSPWSPDGTRLVFANGRAPSAALYIVNVDGTGLRQLTSPTLSAEFNGWSPSGARIAFTSAAAGTKDVYVIDPDGSGLVNLTASPSHDSDALWLPR